MHCVRSLGSRCIPSKIVLDNFLFTFPSWIAVTSCLCLNHASFFNTHYNLFDLRSFVFFFCSLFCLCLNFSHCLFNLSQIAMPLLFLCVSCCCHTFSHRITVNALLFFSFLLHVCIWLYSPFDRARAHTLYFTLSKWNVVWWFANTLVRNTRNERKKKTNQDTRPTENKKLYSLNFVSIAGKDYVRKVRAKTRIFTRDTATKTGMQKKNRTVERKNYIYKYILCSMFDLIVAVVVIVWTFARSKVVLKRLVLVVVVVVVDFIIMHSTYVFFIIIVRLLIHTRCLLMCVCCCFSYFAVRRFCQSLISKRWWLVWVV